MKMRPLVFAVLLAAPVLAGAERSCQVLDDSSGDDPSDPTSPAQPFLDAFNGGLVFWRLTSPIPREDLATGNPLPSMEVGSVSTLVTGGVTVRRFDTTGGLLIEADVFWEAPSASTTAMPEAWVGLSDDDDPVGTPQLAAGIRVDDAGILHYQVNGVDIGTGAAPAAGSWHRFSTTIRVDRVVEFRVDGSLVLTGGSLDPAHLVRPVEACGIGFPERPKFDNVSAKLP